MLNNNLKSQIKAALEGEEGIQAAYIIGSTITGQLHPESDFDLVVVVKNCQVLRESQVYEFIKHLQFPKDLDLSVVDHTSSPFFLYQIISKGEKVYEKDSSAVGNFEANVLHTYYDTAHMRNIYHQALKNKFPYAN